MDLCNIHDVKALLDRHGFRFSKSMGQNFLVAGWVPVRTAEAAELDECCGVLEVGPGIGPLTVQLAARAGRVAAVELDRALLPVLEETLAGCPNAEVIPGDVMKLDLNALLDEKLAGLRPVACANLPYNITTPVLTRLLDLGRFSSITVMIQREAAGRICAKPGMADYGAFSVFCQYHARCEVLFDVGPDCFFPPPKVTSSVLRMVPRTPAPAAERKRFLAVVRAAFAQRRKTLLNALSPAFGSRFSKEELRQIILECGFSEQVRGEQLGLEDFCALADRLK